MISNIKQSIISATIWFYGWSISALILIFLTLIALIFPPRWYNDFGRMLLRFIVWLFGGRVIVEGLENIDRQRTYLFMPNHVSLFDVPVLGGHIPNYTRGIQAAEQFRWPIVGWLLVSIGMIPIRRASAHSSWSTLERAVQEIKAGKSILIMPEGTRTRTGQLGNFKRLPFRLAQMAEADLVPIGLSGLYHFKARTSWHIHPGPIKVKFGKPIPYAQIKELSIEQLQVLVRERLQSLIETP